MPTWTEFVTVQKTHKIAGNCDRRAAGSAPSSIDCSASDADASRDETLAGQDAAPGAGPIINPISGLIWEMTLTRLGSRLKRPNEQSRFLSGSRLLFQTSGKDTVRPVRTRFDATNGSAAIPFVRLADDLDRLPATCRFLDYSVESDHPQNTGLECRDFRELLLEFRPTLHQVCVDSRLEDLVA
jgi:hypothetical protein